MSSRQWIELQSLDQDLNPLSCKIIRVVGDAQDRRSGSGVLQELVAIEPEWLPELAPHMFSTTRPTL